MSYETRWECTWGDLAVLRYGKALRNYNSGLGDVPVYGTNGRIGYTEKPLCHCNGIIIGRKGAYRGVHYSGVPFNVIDTAFFVEFINQNIIDTKWAYYQLLTVDINAMDSGSAIPSTSREDFYALDILLPPLPEQKAIASLLSTLDDKIEINNRINKTLEEMAQAIFKCWFIDFEPFQDGEFVDSELGRIPKGWRVSKIGKVCQNVTDGVHNTVIDDPNGNYYLLSCKNIKNGRIFINTNERRINRETFEKLRKRTKLEQGDILLSSVGTVGEFVLLMDDPLNIEFQRSVAILKPNKSIISSEFLYEALLSRQIEIIHSAHGAVQQCLFIGDIKEFKIILPPYEIISEFTLITSALFEYSASHNIENNRLAELRNMLLPKLMSGEIRVPM